ncbi:hypothetical protein EV201_2754 [Ancylomarina subtilis]|uniref:Uncharacterized protein n=1 Tax=Ancylomarina subtilis TaxID=1639035 RepID=A0A4Q7VA07_9BACT|nr:hypothetical protein [Ancylomarina subtilis]RZT93581.1 hypothetical protein EV201_2754 [Ancylomarina subtilis]
MEKTIRVEIENEYKTQIAELEENLKSVGEFEANAQSSVAFLALTRGVNFIFSWGFFLLGVIGLIAFGFYFKEIINLIDQKFSLGIESSIVGYDGEILKGFLYLKYLIMLTFGLCLMLSVQLKTIRKKNALIIGLDSVVSDFKMRSVRMLDEAKNRLKNYTKLIAEERFSK